MSIVKAKTNSYGPATLDIQIEQGCDFSINLTISKDGNPLDLTGFTLEALLSPTWAPGESAIDMTVGANDLSVGQISISLPGSETEDMGLPNPPSKTRSSRDSRLFALGGWAFYLTDLSGVRSRYIEGDVTLDRDPGQG